VTQGLTELVLLPQLSLSVTFRHKQECFIVFEFAVIKGHRELLRSRSEHTLGPVDEGTTEDMTEEGAGML
jgi:hypothetical protein